MKNSFGLSLNLLFLFIHFVCRYYINNWMICLHSIMRAKTQTWFEALVSVSDSESRSLTLIGTALYIYSFQTSRPGRQAAGLATTPRRLPFLKTQRVKIHRLSYMTQHIKITGRERPRPRKQNEGEHATLSRLPSLLSSLYGDAPW